MIVCLKMDEFRNKIFYQYFSDRYLASVFEGIVSQCDKASKSKNSNIEINLGYYQKI